MQIKQYLHVSVYLTNLNAVPYHIHIHNLIFVDSFLKSINMNINLIPFSGFSNDRLSAVYLNFGFEQKMSVEARNYSIHKTPKIISSKLYRVNLLIDDHLMITVLVWYKSTQKVMCIYLVYCSIYNITIA